MADANELFVNRFSLADPSGQMGIDGTLKRRITEGIQRQELGGWAQGFPSRLDHSHRIGFGAGSHGMAPRRRAAFFHPGSKNFVQGLNDLVKGARPRPYLGMATSSGAW
jgi:hypothetical protein